jgi:ClpP class serine protease
LSAGYALASQADRIILPRTGEVGSIGILVMHADYSPRLSDEGVQITMIHAGANKVDGNPYEPLPEAVRDELQRELEGLRMLFADTVAAGRGGRMSAQAALDTQARVFRGADAVALGLADEVSDMRAAFARFADHIHRRPVAATPIAAQGGNTKEPSMNARTTTALADTAPQPAPETVDTAVVDTSQDTATATEDTPVAIEDAAGANAAPRQTASLAGSLTLADAAEIAEIGAQAARLGINIDVPKAIRDGHRPDALRARVLEEASARDAASAVFTATPAASQAPKESPIVAAAKRAAAQAASRLVN